MWKIAVQSEGEKPNLLRIWWIAIENINAEKSQQIKARLKSVFVEVHIFIVREKVKTKKVCVWKTKSEEKN